MIEFIIFAAVAWFAISIMKDMMHISEKKAIEKAKKEAKDAREVVRAATDAARAEARAKAAAAKAAAEEMVNCAICGTQMAKHDAIATQGRFYCSEAHFLQRNQSESTAETIAEPIPQATVENI